MGISKGTATAGLHLADTNRDGVLDLAILTAAAVFVNQVGTWVQKLHQAVSIGTRLAIANAQLSGPGQLLVATTAPSQGGASASENTLTAWTGRTYQTLWTLPLGDATVQAMATADVDGDEEFLVAAAVGLDGPMASAPWNSRSLLLIGSPLGSLPVVESYLTGQDGEINGWAILARRRRPVPLRPRPGEAPFPRARIPWPCPTALRRHRPWSRSSGSPRATPPRPVRSREE